ncbi:MAG: hypothetical protein MUF22_09140 [Chitinispirillaceae bacterium]|nr:hypothetical protein [Chitinispirillaceae bacterium]
MTTILLTLAVISEKPFAFINGKPRLHCKPAGGGPVIHGDDKRDCGHAHVAAR